MNKQFSKKVEQAARKHEKLADNRNRNCFTAGAQFCDKNSSKQYTEKDMFQMLYDGVGHFAHKNNITINGNQLQKWFKEYIRK
jgi:hypothetical protein